MKENFIYILGLCKLILLWNLTISWSHSILFGQMQWKKKTTRNWKKEDKTWVWYPCISNPENRGISLATTVQIYINNKSFKS